MRILIIMSIIILGLVLCTYSKSILIDEDDKYTKNIGKHMCVTIDIFGNDTFSGLLLKDGKVEDNCTKIDNCQLISYNWSRHNLNLTIANLTNNTIRIECDYDIKYCDSIGTYTMIIVFISLIFIFLLGIIFWVLIYFIIRIKEIFSKKLKKFLENRKNKKQDDPLKNTKEV